MDAMDLGHSTTSIIGAKLGELQAAVYDTEPGTLSVDSGTVRLLELYLHWLPAADQRRWFAEHGEALRQAVFG